MTLVDTVAKLSQETEAAVAALFASRRAGDLTEEEFLRQAAALLLRANVRASAAADAAIAAQLTAQGVPAAPVGILPPNGETERLVRALHNTRFGSPEVAEDIREERLKRLARSEPKSTAQDATQEAGKRQPEAKGWKRVADADACELCRKWEDGKVRDWDVKMLRHVNCGCVQRAVAGKAKKAAKFAAGYLATSAAARVVAQDIVPRVYGRTRVLAGGRGRYQRLSFLEEMLAGPKRAQTAEKRRLQAIIDAGGLDAEQAARDLAVLQGEFLARSDVYAFVDQLRPETPYTGDELDAMWDYAGLYVKRDDATGAAMMGKGPAGRLNAKLRWGEAFGEITPEEWATIETLDGAIARTVTPRPVTLWRGAHLPKDMVLGLAQLEPGTKLVDQAYMFTGLTEARALPHTRLYGGDAPDNLPLLMKLNVPKGMPAIHSPYGEALAAQPDRLPAPLRYLPGLARITGRRRRPIEVPLGLIPGMEQRTLRIRVPFLEYFNKEEIVLPRQTALRFQSARLRDDGILEVEMDVVKPRRRLAARPMAGEPPELPDDLPGDELIDPVEVEERIRSNHGITARLRGATPVVAAQVERAVDRVRARYPALRLDRIDVAPDVDETLPWDVDRVARPWEQGEVAVSGMPTPVGRRFISVNPAYAADPERVRTVLEYDRGQFASRNVEHLLIHELGHHVLDSYTDGLIRQFAQTSGMRIYPDPSDPDGHRLQVAYTAVRTLLRKRVDDVVRHHTGHSMNSYMGREAIRREISGYAATWDWDIDQLDIDELVGEAFTQVMVGRYGRTPADWMTRIGDASPLARDIIRLLDSGFDELGLPLGPGTDPRPDIPGLRRIRGPAPVRISSTRKTAGRRAGQGPAVSITLYTDAAVPKVIARQSQVPGYEDLRRRRGRDAIEEIVERQKTQLVEMGERVRRLNPDVIAVWADWYPFIHRWLNDLADNVAGPVTRNGAYATTAVLSPGAEWPDNVAWAKRLIQAVADDVEIKREWVVARHDLNPGKYPLRTDLVGKRLSQLDDDDAAYAMRGWHDHEPVYQLGGHHGFGDPTNKTRPQTHDNLRKAMSVLRDSSLENLDKEVGGQKVRSFYSNISDPLDTFADDDVTVDTHHFGILNGLPWTTSSRFISTETGSLNLPDRPGSGPVAGTYPIGVDATRRAARELNAAWGTNYRPSQIQSVLWEMWQALLPDFNRRGRGAAAMNRKMEQARTARARGHITRDEEATLVEYYRLTLGGTVPVGEGAPTEAEIMEWMAADLAGRPREKLSDMRRRRARGRRRRRR